MKKEVNKTKDQGINYAQEARHTNVLLESMKDSMKFLAETVIGVAEKVDIIDARLVLVEGKVNKIESNDFLTQAKLTSIYKKTETIEAQNKIISSDISTLKADVSSIKKEVVKKVDIKDFKVLSKQVVK